MLTWCARGDGEILKARSGARRSLDGGRGGFSRLAERPWKCAKGGVQE